MTGVRVLGYNIRSLRDDPAAVAGVIRALGPDVACLQEVPRFAGWRRKRRGLARACGMRVAAGRRAAGLAVLAGPRARIVHGEHHLLSRVPGLHRRGLAVAVLEFGGARLVAASTHLDLAGAPRRAHTAEIIDLLDGVGRAYRAPVVLAGDVNEEPGGESWTLLAARFQDAHAVAPEGEGPTFPARRPARRIDGVFADPRIEVTGCGVPGGEAAASYARATDHRPVLAGLRLPPAPGPGPASGSVPGSGGR
ncbi:endonuclease/exonuclease/phosphatase family protein [Actinomadura viridis]|uniref:Endonuclease/exonuclease/phosphatase family metal-dependent hydrolase n=1 Tax=Actinomadura viridis TaxID=58110 RepID=A0A931DHE5_9ACTN|nr:endonuclease/exonuclease/phosphatase family protein [Actinomadura viridis]MBG6088272.1 endonuclease/exonuclease/phosphatase family metal-dependent hydrolase [Actinomadura viridis]